VPALKPGFRASQDGMNGGSAEGSENLRPDQPEGRIINDMNTEHSMHQDEIKAIFDQQAASYDTQWAKTAPIRNCLYFLLDALFADLPADARILCVGVGTGVELAHLAQRNPGWRFSTVEPSGPMLDVCRQRAETEGFASRCQFHEDYLEPFYVSAEHDAATCFLVSKFILDQQARSEF